MLDDSTSGVISVWLGTTHQSLEQFNAYTEGLENPDSGCAIHRDFGCRFIDTDFFVAYGTHGNQLVPVEELANEIDCNSRATQEAIVARCHELGISEGNSLYYYCNCTFTEDVPGRLYNDLRFIGAFPDD